MGDAGEGLIDADARIQERMEELERERSTSRTKDTRDPGTGACARVAEARADRAGTSARATTHERRRAQIDAGHRGSRSPHERDECRRPIVRFTGITTAPNTTFNRFARSLGYLDWATQPRPFRSFVGRTSYPLYPAPGAGRRLRHPSAVEYDQFFERHSAGDADFRRRHRRSPAPFARTVCVESLRIVAVVVARQSVERQPPSDRGLRGLRSAPGPGRTRRPCYHYAADAARPRAALSRSTRRTGRCVSAGRRRGPRRADVDSLAGVVEVRRACVPILPARSRSRDRGRQPGGGDAWVAHATFCPRGHIGDGGAHRDRPRRRFRRCGT